MSLFFGVHFSEIFPSRLIAPRRGGNLNGLDAIELADFLGQLNARHNCGLGKDDDRVGFHTAFVES